MRTEQMQIVAHHQIAKQIFELTLTGQLVRDIVSPGQFVHVRVTNTLEPLLRRPISIAAIDEAKQTMTLIYRADGRGTRLLSTKCVGEKVDVLGPLGNGFQVAETDSGQTAYLIGGGIGVPPLYELSKQLTKKGVRCLHILGFQSADVVFYEQQFKALGDTYVATVDGSKGTQGFVTDVMQQLDGQFDTYYSCGPIPMLRAVQAAYPNQLGFLSFEQRMGCGIGACFACVCQTTDQVSESYVKVCSDGPVFRAGVVSI